jgi:hypothetical protein
MTRQWLAILAFGLMAAGAQAYAADQPDTKATQPNKSAGYRPSIVVYKNVHCDCCLKWVEYLEANRFNVRVVNVDDLGKEKRRVGIPKHGESCHTAEIEGYFIEGHVPADDIKRLIRLKPDAKGLTVPAMPIGSPGMERGTEFQPYEVLLVDKAGNTTVFSRQIKPK